MLKKAQQGFFGSAFSVVSCLLFLFHPLRARLCFLPSTVLLDSALDLQVLRCLIWAYGRFLPAPGTLFSEAWVQSPPVRPPPLRRATGAEGCFLTVRDELAEDLPKPTPRPLLPPSTHLSTPAPVICLPSPGEGDDDTRPAGRGERRGGRGQGRHERPLHSACQRVRLFGGWGWHERVRARAGCCCCCCCCYVILCSCCCGRTPADLGLSAFLPAYLHMILCSVAGVVRRCRCCCCC